MKLIKSIWIAKSKLKINKITALPNNWDGYDSVSLSDKLKQNAIKFLMYLEIKNIPVPNVVPISGGGIQLEWNLNDKELEIEFIHPDIVEYLKVFKDGKMEEGEFSLADSNKAREIVGWLISY